MRVVVHVGPVRGDEAHEAGWTLQPQPKPMLVLVMMAHRGDRGSTARWSTFLDGKVVVDLEMPGDVTALDVALGVELLDRAAEPGRDRAPGMRHRPHVGAVDEQHLEERVVEQTLRDRHRKGPAPTISQTSPGSV